MHSLTDPNRESHSFTTWCPLDTYKSLKKLLEMAYPTAGFSLVSSSFPSGEPS